MKIAVFGMNNPAMELKDLRHAFIQKFKRYEPVKPKNTGDTKAMEVYRKQKENVQKLWMKFLEADLYDSISTALERFRAAYLPETLFVILLPEGYFSDLQWDSEDVYASGYWNPFYEETVQDFLNGNLNAEKSLKTLAGDNIMICPGTIWWKEKHDCKDVYFNSAPAFYKGQVIHMWDKQFLAASDPLGDKETTYHKWTDYREAHFGIPHQKDRRSLGIETCRQFDQHGKNAVVLSDLTERYCPDRSDMFHVTFNGRNISFAAEICIDHLQEVYKYVEDAVPDIRICIANDISLTSIIPAEESRHVRYYLLICDGHNRNYVVPANSAATPHQENLGFTCNKIVRSYNTYILDI